jgi:hypothetical protein
MVVKILAIKTMVCCMRDVYRSARDRELLLYQTPHGPAVLAAAVCFSFHGTSSKDKTWPFEPPKVQFFYSGNPHDHFIVSDRTLLGTMVKPFLVFNREDGFYQVVTNPVASPPLVKLMRVEFQAVWHIRDFFSWNSV